MKWIVSFDISDDRRRRSVVKTLLSMGYRVQKSVFEADTDTASIKEVAEKMKQLIDGSTDSVRIYPNCRDDVGKTMLIGNSVIIEKMDYLIL